MKQSLLRTRFVVLVPELGEDLITQNEVKVMKFKEAMQTEDAKE